MTAIVPSAPPAAAAPAPAAAPQREELARAAKQFEAIFVRQMLSAARKTEFGDQLFGGQGMDTFRQMQDDRFADIASERGAFGLAKVIEARLAQMVPSGQPGDAPATAPGGKE